MYNALLTRNQRFEFTVVYASFFFLFNIIWHLNVIKNKKIKKWKKKKINVCEAFSADE